MNFCFVALAVLAGAASARKSVRDAVVQHQQVSRLRAAALPSNASALDEMLGSTTTTGGGTSSGVGTSCSTSDGGSGVCQNTNTACSGIYESGFCPGSADVECCATSWGSCTANGQSGTCQTSSSCSGTSIAGYCPGPSNVECCVSGGPGPGPTPSSIEDAIYQATLNYWGTSTTSGPGGGTEACAWAVNNIVQNAGLQPIGSNPNYVPSVVDALVGGRGQQIDCGSANPGDLVVACGQQHIGVCTAAGCQQIDSNSSSKECFCWQAGYNFDNYFNCGEATCYQVLN